MPDVSGLELASEFLRSMVGESRVDAAETYLADDATITINNVEYTTEEYFERIESSDQQFDVLDVTIEAVVADKGSVALRHVLEFEHSGTAFGVQPENEQFTESSASFFEIEDGEIVTLDITYDQTATLEQLGLLSADPTTEKLRDQYYEILSRVLRHNLRNKLNIILANAETSEENHDVATAKIREQTGELLTTVEKAQKIEQMAIDAPLNPTTFLVSEAITDVLGKYESRHGIKCHCHCPTDVLELRSDKRLFQNILEETLQNAILYTDTDTPEVTIAIDAATAKGHAVELEIADNGPGIPESELEPLREDRETQLLHGSGIGLWIIKWCVTRLGGEIAFDGGDSIHITLPNLEH